MRISLLQHFRTWSLAALLVCALQPPIHADPPIVRYTQGTFHGFLEMLSPDGQAVAYGDSTQVVHGDRITSHTLFTFKDGSTDEETAIFTQHHEFQLISDHHIQKGPFFPHPMEVFVDTRSGEFTTRTTGKDGKEEVKTSHVRFPDDLANGLVPLVVENMGAAESSETVSMVVATPSPLVAKLVISKLGEDSYSLVGTAHKAIHFEIKIQLGGVAGFVAPLIGKAPPNIEIWTVNGLAPTFVREQGPIYADGPVMTIQLTSPTWSEASKSGD
jgi:hypothetical protein